MGGGDFVGGKKMYVGNACTLMMGVIFFEFVCINVINNNNNVYDILLLLSSSSSSVSPLCRVYTYIPETNHVPREHCVATILM